MQIKDKKDVGKALSEIVRKKFTSWVDVTGQKIGINQRTANEWAYSKDAQRLYSKEKSKYADKTNAFGVADELLKVSRDYIGEQNKHLRKDNFREFARGKVNFKIGANGYEADIIVGTTKNGAAILYDMVNITPKKIVEAPNMTLSAQNAEDRRQDASTKDSISKNDGTVKTKFSAEAQTGQEQEARYVTNARNDLLRDLQGKTGIPFVWGAEQVRHSRVNSANLHRIRRGGRLCPPEKIRQKQNCDPTKWSQF